MHWIKPARTSSVINQSVATSEDDGREKAKKEKKEASILVYKCQGLTRLPVLSLRHGKERSSARLEPQTGGFPDRMSHRAVCARRSTSTPTHSPLPSHGIPVFPVSCARRHRISVKVDPWQLRALLHICLTLPSPSPQSLRMHCCSIQSWAGWVVTRFLLILLFYRFRCFRSDWSNSNMKLRKTD